MPDTVYTYGCHDGGRICRRLWVSRGVPGFRGTAVI
jgi:hypothetical protein